MGSSAARELSETCGRQSKYRYKPITHFKTFPVSPQGEKLSQAKKLFFQSALNRPHTCFVRPLAGPSLPDRTACARLSRELAQVGGQATAPALERIAPPKQACIGGASGVQLDSMVWCSDLFATCSPDVCAPCAGGGHRWTVVRHVQSMYVSFRTPHTWQSCFSASKPLMPMPCSKLIAQRALFFYGSRGEEMQHRPNRLPDILAQEPHCVSTNAYMLGIRLKMMQF